MTIVAVQQVLVLLEDMASELRIGVHIVKPTMTLSTAKKIGMLSEEHVVLRNDHLV